MIEISVPKIPMRINFSWMLVGRGVYSACNWGILIALTKMGSPEIVGQYGLALAVTAPVLALLNLTLRDLLVTDSHTAYDFSTYWGLRLTTSAIALLACVFIGFWYQPVFFVILGMGLAKSLESISDLLFGLMQKHEQMKYIAQSNILNGMLSLACVTGVFAITHSLGWSILGLAIVNGGVLIFYDLPNTFRFLPSWKELKPRYNLVTWRELAWLAAPLAIAAVLISFGTNIPRYFVEYFHGQEALGYFTAISYLIVAGDLLFSALRQVSAPRLAKHYRENRPKFMKLLLQLVSMSIGLGIGGILLSIFWGKEFLKLFYVASYAQYTNVLTLLAVVGMLRYIFGFLYSAMLIMRLLRIQLLILIASTVVSIVMAWLLIPSYGQIGAVWVLLAGAFTNLILGTFAIFMHYSVK